MALLAGAASAQSIGVKAGLNYTTLTGDDANNFDYRPGYTVGVTARRALNDLIGVQTEVLFTSKGAKREFDGSSTEIQEKQRLNYIDVPVLFNVQTNGLYFELGPQVSFLVKAKEIKEVSRSNSTTTSETEITDLPYPIDLGYAAGLGYRTNSGIGLGFRYTGSFKKLFDEGLLEDLDIRNTSFQLTLSYTTGL